MKCHCTTSTVLAPQVKAPFLLAGLAGLVVGFISAFHDVMFEKPVKCTVKIRNHRLFRFFNALGSDVEIRPIAKPESDSQAKTRVVATSP